MSPWNRLFAAQSFNAIVGKMGATIGVATRSGANGANVFLFRIVADD